MKSLAFQGEAKRKRRKKTPYGSLSRYPRTFSLTLKAWDLPVPGLRLVNVYFLTVHRNAKKGNFSGVFTNITEKSEESY